MLKYIIGILKNLFNPAVSLLTKIDKYSYVDRKAKVYPFARIFRSKLGAYSYIGKHSSLVYAEIGKFCSISGNVSIGLGVHTLNNLSTSPIFTEKNNATGYSWTSKNDIYPYKKVIVGNDVWIGFKAIIIGGVEIGNGAVIGAGAVVTKDVPPYAVMGGVPAKIIKYRFSVEVIDYLESLKWWNLSEDILRKHIDLFQADRIDIEKIDNEINK